MSIEKFTVSRDDSIYEAWPDLVLTESGKLICVFTECAAHLDRSQSRLMLCESTDRGRSWSQKRPLTEIGDASDYYNNARISRIGNRLAIVCDKIHGHEKDGNAAVHLWWGDAEGTHWEGPFMTPVRGIVPDKLKQLQSGRLLLTAHRKNPVSGKLEQYLRYSDDQGKTWSDEITVAADARYHLCEASILEVSQNTLVAFLRENSGLGVACLKTVSHDGGASWSEVYETPIPACHRPVSGFLQDGRIMITHRFMQGGKGFLGSWTQNVFVAFTDVDSALATKRAEQTARIMPLDYDRSPLADLGYTGWIQFADGEIYVVNYIVDDAPKAQIRGYSFEPHDIMLDAAE